MRRHSPAILGDALVRTGARDERAFRDVCALTRTKLLSVCLRIVGDPSDAEEVLQDVYFSIWRKAGSFDPARASAIAWLAAIARNKSIDKIRQRGEYRFIPLDGATDPQDPSPTASTVLEMREDHAQVDRAMEVLSAEQLQVISMAFQQGLTHEDVAAAIDVPLGTAKSRIRAGLIRLRAFVHMQRASLANGTSLHVVGKVARRGLDERQRRRQESDRKEPARDNLRAE